MDPGQGGTIAAAAAGSQGIGATVRSTGSGANAVTLSTESGRSLNLTGGLEGAGDFKKSGVGTVQIGGNSPTFTGLVEVNQGDLVVNSGANLGSSSSLRVNSGGRLKGSGTVGALTVASGGRLAVGNSPGTMTASSSTWQGGGILEWELNNFLGSAGTNWDFLNVSGLLDITATSGNRFIIEVISLLSDNATDGALAGFNTSADYDFLIATAAGGITNFNVDDFTIVTSRFANATGSGSSGDNLWSLSTQGNNLYLSYSGATAIPEPSSVALTLIGLGVLALRRRLRG
jgi:autotransporter-associated beta strand protein